MSMKYKYFSRRVLGWDKTFLKVVCRPQSLFRSLIRILWVLAGIMLSFAGLFS